MAYDIKAYNEWEKNAPKATDADKAAVKAMYKVPTEAEQKAADTTTPAAPASK